MLRRQVLAWLAFLLLAGGIGWTVVHLFELRLSTGDVYPPASTLRPDPLGAKALLDALNLLPGVRARRNFQPLVKLPLDEHVALFYLGVDHEGSWEEKELEHFESLVSVGSRAVFAFQPVRADTRTAAERAEAAKTKKNKEEEQPSRLEVKIVSFADAAQQWGFAFQRRERRPDEPAVAQARLEPGVAGLEPALRWHSELFFAKLAPAWKVLYRAGGEPVLIERPWHRGSIVLAADSYFLSNEALRSAARAPHLLAWLIGAQRSVVFDEEHLGIAEQSGIATLARKYRLHGLVAGLALVALLFIWQNLVRFLPPAEGEEAEAAVGGRGSSEGFLALLRRSVPASQLLATCLAEWRRACGHDALAGARLDSARPAELARARKAPEILAAYRTLAASLRKTEHPRPASQPSRSIP